MLAKGRECVVVAIIDSSVIVMEVCGPATLVLPSDVIDSIIVTTQREFKHRL